jgi:hypothetical protein
MKKIIKQGILILFVIAFAMILNDDVDAVETIDDIKLVVDGKDITERANPVLIENRTMVPIRFISEEIGAKVTWDPEERTVLVVKDNRSVFLRIDSHFVTYDDGKFCQVTDVAPLIIKDRNKDDRTYVPLRLISNALGIGIEWVEKTRTVQMYSDQASVREPFFDMTILNIQSGDLITGKTQIELNLSENLKNKASEMKVLLLNKETGKGFVVGRTTDTEQVLVYTPKIEDKGEKALTIVLYDENGDFLAGEAILVNVDVAPKVSIKGSKSLGLFSSSINVTPDVNFVATGVQYEFTHLSNGKVTVIKNRDPYESYSWETTFEQNGDYTIKVTAFDSLGQAYESENYFASVLVPRYLSLRGVSEGMVVNKPVTLIASRNFDVTETQYVMKDIKTGKETILKTVPYGGYTWFPVEDESGSKELTVRVKDIYSRTHESNPILVEVDGRPAIQMKGVGPNQVMTVNANLFATSNVELESLTYILTNYTKGTERIINPEEDYNWSASFYALPEDEGEVSLHAEGLYKGEIISSEKIKFRIYLGEVYAAQPLIEKENFLALASEMAVHSWEKTGMSAALQTAQAILESGWGQSVPVDKYTGHFSYNLFGIKGTGTNGSVISNTWEVYNGVSFRTDAAFRAYNTVEESWLDHKNILLQLDRYAPFREVMYDSTLGAYAIRRAGYATDPEYPSKLIRIINQYNLIELDRIGL